MFLSRLITISLAFFAFSQTAWAGQITLKSTTSSVELTGTLINFDNEVYIIETDLGEIEVDARTVTCTGAECPEIKSLASDIDVFGSQALVADLLIPLFESYSFSLDAGIETAVETDTKSKMIIVAQTGQAFANVSFQSGTASDLKEKISASQSALVIKSVPSQKLSIAGRATDIVPIASDALVAIVSETNSVKSISLDGLRAVLSGKTSNWKDLGGPDVDINIYLPGKQSDLAQIAKDLGFDISAINATERFDDLAELSKTAANDPYGLGLINFANRRTATVLPILGNCGAYVRPSAFSISTGSYPATYYHYLQPKSKTPPIFAREFLAYLNGAQAKSMIDRLGYPSLSVFENGLENQGSRVVHGLLQTPKTVSVEDYRSMLKTLNGARQLSTVFRFIDGSSTLSPQSAAALNAIISELFLGNYADQTLMIIGFTGAKGDTGDDKKKSEAAAQAIANYIKDADEDDLFADLQIDVLGFGRASPLVCEDTQSGVATNNRVEIWVKDNF